MVPTSVAGLIKLPANERAELTMALWNSLSDAERDAEFALTLREAGNTEVSGVGPARRRSERSGR